MRLRERPVGPPPRPRTTSKLSPETDENTTASRASCLFLYLLLYHVLYHDGVVLRQAFIRSHRLQPNGVRAHAGRARIKELLGDMGSAGADRRVARGRKK